MNRVTGHVGFQYAFQPIVDVEIGRVASQEALIRGLGGASPADVFAAIPARDADAFDRLSRLEAVRSAGALGLQCRLNLNARPGSLEGGVGELVARAEAVGLRPSQLVIEVTEREAIADVPGFIAIIDEYRTAGVGIAIDDFGSGHSGLNLLADFQPDTLKLDMNLVRGIEGHGPRQAIVRAIHSVCGDLGIDVIAEGVETVGEFAWLQEAGIRLFQGYLLAKPRTAELPDFRLPDPEAEAA